MKKKHRGFRRSRQETGWLQSPGHWLGRRFNGSLFTSCLKSELIATLRTRYRDAVSTVFNTQYPPNPIEYNALSADQTLQMRTCS
ncbi:hypothetical protein FA13DRAFT_1088258 [Coprinellus micaceus]|uniref:Uncharacterized protein n=1 Tax=Coprinellus micaceus TaxID=71717 RepID=A0A4Y7TSD8_COPMI|nr:hypothetical protein FA13DRAFT_1088258 [Coprinellus micaceus]